MLAAWQAKFDALSLRERLMVAIAAFAATYFLVDALLLGSWQRQNAGIKATLLEQRAESARTAAQVQEQQVRAGSHPDALARARIREIEQKIAAIDASLQSSSKQLVPPERMASLLEDLLKGNKRLQLAKLATLPAEALLAREPASGAAQAAEPMQAAAEQPAGQNIFKHGVELTLRGNYFDMLDYLAQIEALPWQMYWGRLRLEARDYNRPVLTLTLYTLSLDKTWLTI
ncbi:MAG: agglutinin biogenesis protein [Rhodocyclaceae bacterium]|nr:agglutinin biogenesis protein [Rhodocyclaceae bacterium]HNQ57185.1 agglutinin biogenesis protein [Candidatus Desulfobacillus denitrificans]